MWQMFEFMLCMELLNSVEQERRNYERARRNTQRDAMRAARRALAAKRDQLWRQVHALRGAADRLSQEFAGLCDAINEMRNQRPRPLDQLRALEYRREEIKRQQAELKNLRQRMHDEIGRIKTESEQYYW